MKYFLFFWLGLVSLAVQAQDPTDSIPGDPGALSVYSTQDLQFGAFSTGASGGSVTISPTGVRSVTGTVTALDLGFSYNQAEFEIAAPLGVTITVMNGSNVSLTGSNGGSMTLALGGSSPASPFINTTPSPSRTTVGIGGTLTVGSAAANPPGTYSGVFYVTFNQE